MKPTDIKAARAELNMTLAELAARVGVTLRAVQNWEAGTRKPTGPAVIVIESLLAERRARTAG